MNAGAVVLLMALILFLMAAVGFTAMPRLTRFAPASLAPPLLLGGLSWPPWPGR